MSAGKPTPVPREQNISWGRVRWLWLPARPRDSYMAVSLVELHPGASIPPHGHLGEEQVLIVLAGEGSHRVDRRWSSLAPGEAHHVPADCVHEMLASPETSLRFLVLASATRSRFLHTPAREEPARVLHVFARQSGLTAKLIAASGATVHAPVPELTLCQLVCDGEKGRAVCRETLASAARRALAREDPVPFRCCCPGTLSVAAPVPRSDRRASTHANSDGQLVVVVGPLLTADGDEQRVWAWAKTLGLPGNRELLVRARAGLPVAPVYRLWSAAVALQSALGEPTGSPEAPGPGAKRPGAPASLRPPSAHPLVEAAQQYLRSAPTDRLKLTAVSRELGVSMSHLSRTFAAHAGCSFREYVRRLKVERAREMLVSTSYPVRRIASLCGYRDLSQFEQVFKEETGLTPAAYRRRLRLSPRLPSSVP